MRSGDTIVALSSGGLPSGVAVIRISGPASPAIVAELAGQLPEPRKLRLTNIDLGAQTLDQGLLAWFPGPHSFTGEDSAELQVHGSPAGVKAILRALTARPGIRLAEAGEFTRRAFENGKLDLTEVEGLGDLIAAETESQRKQALLRFSGGLSQKLTDWRERLLDARAEIEARLDFSDEGDVGDLPESFHLNLAALGTEMATALEDVTRGRIVREGARIALAGPPNAGKSSLLNALAKSDIAIVTDEAGTTRDVREVPVDLDGQLAIFVDMAGLRDTDSKAEAEGVRRARNEIEQADLVLWLMAPDVQTTPEIQTTGAPVLRIATKADLSVPDCKVDLAISIVDGSGLQELRTLISRFVGELVGEGEPGLVSRERDRVALAEAATALAAAQASLAQSEIAAEHLRAASNALERLLGRMDVEHVLDHLFARFCIGK